MTLVVHPHFHRRRTGITRHVESVVPALNRIVETRIVETGATGLVLAPLDHVSLGAIWSRARNEPIVWHAHRNNELFAGLILRALRPRLRVVFTRHASHRPSWITRLLAKRADRVVSLTDEVARAVGMPSTVIHHGLDLERFRPPQNREEAWTALGIGGRFGVGVVGRIREAKGQRDFAEAIRPLLPLNPEWRAVCVGAALGDDRAWADELIRKTPGLTIVPEQADVAPWFRGLSILVHPSHAEAFSLALLEGLASGCCVVSSRLAYAEQSIEDGRTGFLFAPGRTDELRKILESLLRDPARVASVGAAAAEDARARFGVDAEARSLEAIYRDLAQS